ncbi:adenine deaminase [Methanococcus aeolicus]|uniref:adenine deaminase n=1 Tax=Methanococcus aeolicus TaxID=42879 RepID=UPI0021C9CE45|nr:adenine deaminase [Methanococcus aeolicus]UXM84521.1 adenine deaminase [Methanococcus aeolicus]
MIILKNANIVGVRNGTIVNGSIGINGDKIAFVDYIDYNNHNNDNIYNKNENTQEIRRKQRFNTRSEAPVKIIDLKGKFVCPTFIDAHIHIESSHITPSEFEKYALKYGVSKVIIDPHEIANVVGVNGIKFMLNDAKLLDVYCMVPSCVPATELETNGAPITSKDIEELFKQNNYRILGLGEVMNYIGVINKDKNIIDKINMAKKYNKLIDGHAPQLTREDLINYVNMGIMLDHECTTEDEALEKLKLGLKLMVREGTASKNIYLLKIIDILKRKGIYNKLFKNIMLVSDDISVKDLKEGYLINTLKKAVKYVSPIEAIQMITINPANYFGLDIEIKPDNYADLIIFDDLEEFKINSVIIKGKFLNELNKYNKNNNIKNNKNNNDNLINKSINYNYKTENDFLIDGIDGGGAPISTNSKVRIIEPIGSSLITNEIMLNIDDAKTKLKNNEINRIFVLERHRNTNKIGKGLIKYLKTGTIASSYAHDSHNVIVIGNNLKDIAIAVNHLKDMGGGFVAVKDGKIIEQVKLNIGGIMGADGEYIYKKINDIENKTKNWSIIENNNLFLSMSFLSLSVIPNLKITDFGLIKNNKIVNLVEL